MNNKVELLAPAGGLEQLKAAISNGADAIYFGGEKFSARANANNFSNEEIIIARRLTRKHGVKLYCAINTLIFNDELQEAINYVAFLAKTGIDALIIQDMGLITMVRKYFPDMEIHSSTQLSIQNSYGLEFLKDIGVDRAVLPRESSLNDIKRMNKSGLELEAFVHGAICICFSGQCLMSSMIGGRSGNRGACAQPCRLKYKLIDYKTKEVLCNDASYLSPKDMMLLNSVDRLIDAGVKSFKIEGRMKTPEYVATVVKYYRRAIDAALSGETHELSSEENQDISQVFSRDFTDSYLEGKSGKEMMNINKPNNRGTLVGRVQNYKGGKALVLLKSGLEKGDKISIWTTVEGRVNISIDRIIKDEILVDSADKGDLVLLDVPKRVNRDDRVFKTESSASKKIVEAQIKRLDVDEKIPLTLKVEGKAGQKLSIKFTDDEHNSCIVYSDNDLPQAEKHPLDEESFIRQMRLGDTEYYLDKVELDIDRVMVPKSFLNNLRRKGVEQLTKMRQDSYSFQTIVLEESQDRQLNIFKRPVIGVMAESIDKVKIALEKDVDYIYYPLVNYKFLGSKINDFIAFLEKLESEDRKKIVADLPRFIREDDLDYVISLIEQLRQYIDSYRANTTDQIKMLESLGISIIHGSSGLNVINNAAYEFYNKKKGLHELELSKELNLGQLQSLQKEGQLTVYGIIELMVMEHCIIGSEIGPGNCRNKIYALKDRIDVEFPILVDAIGKNHIINSRKLVIIDELARLRESGFNSFLLNFIMTDPAEMKAVLDIYIDVIKKGKNESQVRERLLDIVSNFTKGHYNRGIK